MISGGDVLFYYNESLDPSSTIDSRDKKQDRIIASHKWLSDALVKLTSDRHYREVNL